MKLINLKVGHVLLPVLNFCWIFVSSMATLYMISHATSGWTRNRRKESKMQCGWPSAKKVQPENRFIAGIIATFIQECSTFKFSYINLYVQWFYLPAPWAQALKRLFQTTDLKNIYQARTFGKFEVTTQYLLSIHITMKYFFLRTEFSSRTALVPSIRLE